MRAVLLLPLAALVGATLALGAPATGSAQVRPTPTIKACHVCDEGLPQGTPLAPVVRAVLFWEEGCPYCSGIMDHVLPPLQDQFGDQLEVVLIQVLENEDVDLLFAVAASYGIPQSEVGVPFLVLGDRALVGATEIRDELPGLIARALQQSGTPASPQHTPVPPDVQEQVGSAAPSPPGTGAAPTAIPAITFLTSETTEPAPPNGFLLAGLVLAGMLGALMFVGYRTWRAVQGEPEPESPPGRRSCRTLALATLALLGLAVAGYLTYIETQLVQAACGPVGDCNAVQSSPYARLFGVLPVGALGMLGYLLILASMAWAHWGQARRRHQAWLAAFGLALLGTLFSIYLTALELWIIKAVCIWCVISAAVMTIILLLSLDPALRSRRGQGVEDDGAPNEGE